MRVAIIDDGICANEVKTNVKRINIDSNANHSSSNDSHATICAKIIEKHRCLELFYDIKFINEDGTSSIEKLCSALEKCLSINIDVINISNGIEFYYEDMPYYKKLYDLCQELKNKGIIIFAAQSNTGRKTIPAHFPSVISVEQIHPKNNILYYPYRHSDIYLNGSHKLIISGKRVITEKCNSYACAYATALLGKTSWFNDTLYKKLISSRVIHSILLMIGSIQEKSIDVPILYVKANPDSPIYRELNKGFALNGYYTFIHRSYSSNVVLFEQLKNMIILKTIQNKIHADIVVTNCKMNNRKYDAMIYELPNHEVILKTIDNKKYKLKLLEAVAFIIEYFS